MGWIRRPRGLLEKVTSTIGVKLYIDDISPFIGRGGHKAPLSDFLVTLMSHAIDIVLIARYMDALQDFSTHQGLIVNLTFVIRDLILSLRSSILSDRSYDTKVMIFYTS